MRRLLPKLLPLIVLLLATVQAGAKSWDNRCGNSDVGLPEWIAGCSAMIDSGALRGRELSAAYAQRGHALTVTRNLARASDDLDRAVSADPTYAVALVNRANYLNVVGKPDRALADANRAVELDPELPLTYFVRAAAAAQLKNYDSAIAD